LFPDSIVYHDRGHQMNDQAKTNAGLLEEISILKQKIKELEHSESERKRAEEALLKSEAQKNVILNGITTNIAFVDKDLRILWVNKTAAESVNKSPDEMTGHTCHEFWADPSKPCKDCPTLRAFQTQKQEHTILHTPDGRIWDERGEPVFDAEGNLICVVEIAQDITERKRAEEALRASEERYRDLSIVDDLTQLYNSRHFYDQLKMEIDRVNRYGQPLTLLLLDLDDFKAFNDAYGHVEGDQVLMRLGQVVKRCLRQTDSAYRYGGEEFTILLTMATSKDGAVTAERIRTEFKKENFSPAPGQDVHVTVSIGLAQYKSEEDMKAFVNRVDQLMYQAKTNGKDRVCPESY